MTDWSAWQRNVSDELKGMSTQDIRDALRRTAHSFSVLMEHWHGDFNISTLIRNANSFNAKHVFYVGKRGYDRRGTVGAHHYVDLTHLKDVDDIARLKSEYTLVGLENNISDCVPLPEFTWPRQSLMIFGEENTGISDELLELCDFKVSIPQWGSVRSMNVGTCSGIAMYDYTTKLCAED
jgi:tRNA G18 (ribose-2'-O)-methylase SpoU